MKEIFKKYKFGFIAFITILVILIAFTVFRYIKSMEAVNTAANEKLLSISEAEINDAGWNIPEIQEKKKDTLRLQKQTRLTWVLTLPIVLCRYN